ncbi:HNH endonuclease [Labrys neptuniae]|uniref:HNH endonuclease signature motif containing protein n=1 Tax=Labrys neptuniae TaxID=376174 RepID=A0ABV3PFY5_9HYPH
MARIRTIKPEFWTDSLMVQFDALTRLLYIGMWTAADDHGALPDEPERLAMEIMPREDVDDVQARIDLLIAAGRLTRMLNDDGSSYLVIEKWTAHQRVDKPSKSRILRENSRKLAIPAESRRKVALKYGCNPGETKEATCYFCGKPGQIYWPRLGSGKPGAWVAFSGLELDHFHPESEGGNSDQANLVLSCEGCNCARRNRTAFAFVTARLTAAGSLPSQAQQEFSRNLRETSRGLLEGKDLDLGRERKEPNPEQQQPVGRASQAALLEDLEIRCREAAGIEKDPSPGLLVIGPIADLIEAGWSLERHVLPALRSAKAAGRKGKTWAYYAKIITDGATTPPKAEPPPQEAAKPELTERHLIQMACRYIERGNDWPFNSPGPGTPGTKITPEILERARAEVAAERQRRARPGEAA